MSFLLIAINSETREAAGVWKGMGGGEKGSANTQGRTWNELLELRKFPLVCALVVCFRPLF